MCRLATNEQGNVDKVNYMAVTQSLLHVTLLSPLYLSLSLALSAARKVSISIDTPVFQGLVADPYPPRSTTAGELSAISDVLLGRPIRDQLIIVRQCPVSTLHAWDPLVYVRLHDKHTAPITHGHVSIRLL